MPDRIQKFLGQLPERQRREIERLVERIIGGEIGGLDLKKLQGSKNVYRVRKGNFRIIYRMLDSEVFIIAIERRSKSTYREF